MQFIVEKRIIINKIQFMIIIAHLTIAQLQ